MHVAAASPLAVDVDRIDPETVARERAIFAEQARESGKPENIIEKMVEGRLRKFYEEVDASEAGLRDRQRAHGRDGAEGRGEGRRRRRSTVTEFVVFRLGEGIQNDDGRRPASDCPAVRGRTAQNCEGADVTCRRPCLMRTARSRCGGGRCEERPCPRGQSPSGCCSSSRARRCWGIQTFGIDDKALSRFAAEIADVARAGTQIAVVIGGGNLFRGLAISAKGGDRVTGDHMGMLATVMNALALEAALVRARHGCARALGDRDAVDLRDLCAPAGGLAHEPRR